MNSSPSTVEPFALRQVVLLESPFKAAMERNARYLLALDADRLLHNTRQYAGLQPKGELYGGWEARGIAGHTLGHYLTALSQQYAATGDGRFRDRIAYIVKEMAECQKAYGDGYIGALLPLELATLRGFKEGKVDVSGSFNFKGGAWVPWYTEHKVLAGLKDAWVLAENEQAKEVTLKLADWIDEVTRNLTPDQPAELVCTYWGGEVGNRTFDILVEGKVIATQTLNRDKPGAFFEKTYAIPEELTRGKQTVEVRFQAHPGNFAGGLFGARILRVRF